MARAADARRALMALVRKESLQILRDPSALLIALVLPVVLLFLFAYAISLDVDDVPVGVVVEGSGAQAQDLAAAFTATPWIDARIVRDRRELGSALADGGINAYVVIPADFDERLLSGRLDSALQVIVDGAQPNTASFTNAYIEGVVNRWLATSGAQRVTSGAIAVEPRFWFNPELESRLVLLPGAIAIVMTMIGTLLTALVVAREWERGTMEALLSTPAGMGRILAGKLLPYFVLGLAATIGCAAIAVGLFGLPLEGSLAALLLLSAAFMLPALGQGLLISAVSRNQFIASQIALMTGFLPAFLLSGFLFEIASMPWPIRWLTTVVPARYYVEGLQTVFLAGDLWSQLGRNALALVAIGTVLLGITALRSRRTLD